MTKLLCNIYKSRRKEETYLYVSMKDDLAKVPEMIGEGMGQMFETMKPDPQMVPDAIQKLIELPKGKRPLRTVVDAITGKFVESANEQVAKQYAEFLTAFGLKDMLQ